MKDKTQTSTTANLILKDFMACLNTRFYGVMIEFPKKYQITNKCSYVKHVEYKENNLFTLCNSMGPPGYFHDRSHT